MTATPQDPRTAPTEYVGRTQRWPLASVPPDRFGTAWWDEQIAPLMEVAQRRQPNAPQQWADAYLCLHMDQSDLRALGRCRDCGQPIVLEQVGRCVYSSCGHYRAQGDLRKKQPYMLAALKRLTPERRAALLALIEGRP